MTALVIGANGLIGSAVSRLLANRGHRMVLVARGADGLEQTRASLEREGRSVSVHALDATDDGRLTELVSGIDDLEVAVNNVGTTHRPTPLGELALDDLDRVLTTSLRTVAVAMRAELGVIRDGGRIVNVASSAGLAGAPGMSAYVAAKHGVVGLTRTAALDYGDRGIRINAVAPGPIESGPIMRQPADVRTGVGAHVALGRMGRADEVAALVDWLASSASSYVTGATVSIDGGKLAGGA